MLGAETTGLVEGKQKSGLESQLYLGVSQPHALLQMVNLRLPYGDNKACPELLWDWGTIHGLFSAVASLGLLHPHR